ncbi:MULTISPECIES: hypothetical protein [Thermodesulfovibrio]|uniref:hypothetical protein n=1 Tax=Thermodesulfovibrio TaxID=28261 RepID=UPI002626311A|nr:hypothetical protein [Thermodesulfovibrio sp.]
MVIDEIIKRYKTLESSDRELLLEVRNRLDDTITLIDAMLFQLNEIEEHTLELQKELESLRRYTKKIQKKQKGEEQDE